MRNDKLKVSKLMLDNQRLWNWPLIQNLFSNYDANHILMLQIYNEGNDFLVWTLNTYIKFTTKSTYKLVICTLVAS